jgi:hypothetical protein
VFANGLDDVALGLHVDLGHEIVLAFPVDLEAMQAVHAADDDFSGSASRTDSNIEQGLHENLERDWQRAKTREGVSGRLEYSTPVAR